MKPKKLPKTLTLDEWKQLGKTRKPLYRQPAELLGPDAGMNTMERGLHTYLRSQLIRGELLDVTPFPFSMRLGPNRYYRPDFLAIRIMQGVEVIECKGRWIGDAKEKWRNAAELFWWARFLWVRGIKWDRRRRMYMAWEVHEYGKGEKPTEVWGG